ncbi:tachykinin-like peptides receptor 99D [Mizuhopecten yessoensis]|uniref:Tachykinin-like peptides receptor 99D n=1 Tax=Mizuhopecten yessoensis TaxID=6573 RepID=A0A210R7I9_MIZYE|nr:tachykinin-like peptides receptor 99D [Mizuhopecten yessoensis]XP_021351384.1 tachykinin-like peptides receptor 99D [Mizuhopecten yessoensis]XP_021351464.1 tachykinin-like peptides receptor 99D [Mizuhopecten yessoensis]XP_021351554.1 tachykinin-like peptides receptor 99D [Mizuhopecten yessoensis]XP_021351635.1 tachykinin-like peptides receptor 99D [Mizuhopecten yessoensis]XP_021351719.1 tachykinin-like peptides receptor 99D [Mizuhopecten yessoensis]XP_021351796.1 tachykinin-like peptides r
MADELTSDSPGYTSVDTTTLLTTQLMALASTTTYMNISNNSGQAMAPEVIIRMLSIHQFERLVPAIIYTALLMAIGTPGNAIVWFIYYSRWRRSSTRIFILALATLDLINCTLTLPVEIFMLFNYIIFDHSFVCKLSRFTTYTCNSAAALILIAIAVDRYQRICRPHENAISTRTSKLVCWLSIILALMTTWPSLVIYGTQDYPAHGVVLKVCLIENAFVTSPYPLAYFTFNCICTLINFITLTVLYIFVGVRVCQRWKFRSTSVRSFSSVSMDDDDDYPTERHSLKKQSKRSASTEPPPSPRAAIKMAFLDLKSTFKRTKSTVSDRRVLRIGKTTLMLFLVTLAYIISFLPFLGIAIHRSINPSAWTAQQKTNEMVYHVFLRSYLLNCAINPIIYSFCNDIFRRECVILFKRIFCCRKTH